MTKEHPVNPVNPVHSVIGVVGAGTMGNGIAQVAARAGYSVIMRDVRDDLLHRGLAAIDKSLQRDVAKERLSGEEKQGTLGRIQTTTKLEDFTSASFVVEAVNEDLAVKTEVFKLLDKITAPHAILASNTSSISITKLRSATGRPAKLIGMPFMNPVPIMKLIEVIRGMATSDETYHRVLTLSEKLGRTALDCQDSPGFVSNLVLTPMINEAIFSRYLGVATRESIDGIMEMRINH